MALMMARMLFLASLPSHFGKAHVITTFELKRGLAAARNIDAMISAFENPEIGFVGGGVLP